MWVRLVLLINVSILNFFYCENVWCVVLVVFVVYVYVEQVQVFCFQGGVVGFQVGYCFVVVDFVYQYVGFYVGGVLGFVGIDN